MKKLSLLVTLAACLLISFSSSSAQSSATQTFSITVLPQTCQDVIAVNTSPAPPNGKSDGKTAYSYTFTANAPAALCALPLKWTVSAGSLPPGLTLTSGGVLSGIIPAGSCTTSGGCVSNFTVTVTDSGTTPGASLKIEMPIPSGKKGLMIVDHAKSVTTPGSDIGAQLREAISTVADGDYCKDKSPTCMCGAHACHPVQSPPPVDIAATVDPMECFKWDEPRKEFVASSCHQ